MTRKDNRRTGDEVAIDGGYQHRALHEGPVVQRFWHQAKQMAIAKLLPPVPDDYVLDIGCGSGVISHHLASAGAQVLAIDGNQHAIAFAERQYGSPDIEFRRGLVDEDFSVDRALDKAYCLELIEHIYYDQARTLLGHVHAALRPGGRIFLTTPNYRSAWPIIEWIMDRVGTAPKLADDQHVEFYHAGKLRRLVNDSGFELESLATKCGLAPWVAPLSWRLATRLQNTELSSSLLLGSILIAVAKKPT